MSEKLHHYTQICFIANRQPDPTEFLAMSILGVMPQWIKDLTDETA